MTTDTPDQAGAPLPRAPQDYIVEHFNLYAESFDTQLVDVLGYRTPEDLARWWPAAFLDVKEIGPSAEISPGSEACCHVKGWLPHTLKFRGRVEDVVLGEKFTVVVWGDFDGRMDCAVTQEGDYCLVAFDWRVYVNKPFVRRLSFLFKLLFYSNHVWVMMLGLRSVNRELARRRGEMQPDAPSPTFPYGPRSRRLRRWLPR